MIDDAARLGSETGRLLRLAPADGFGIAELTAAYNQTRLDYLVPMPMNAERLAAYIRDYDVDLERSLVALEGGRILGLGMLGLRADRGWITRLGVLPTRRRRGIGLALVRGLLDAVATAGPESTVLEVIKGNQAAQGLFRKCGFRELRELLVLRRPPAVPADAASTAIRERVWLDRAAALARLARHPIAPAWTHAPETFQRLPELGGLWLSRHDGSRGWLVFRRQRYVLSHLVLCTEAGDPIDLGQTLLTQLHLAHPELDTLAENVAVHDPHVPAFFKLGYVVAFRRIEMLHHRLVRSAGRGA